MESTRAVINEAKQLAAAGCQAEALAALRSVLVPDTDFSLLVKAAKWVNSATWSGLRPLRVAFLGGGTLDHLIDLLGLWLRLEGVALAPYIPSYDVWRMEILDKSSALYRFNPSIVWLFTHHRDIRLPETPEADQNQAQALAVKTAEEMETYWSLLASGIPGVQILQNNMEPAPARLFGNHEAMLPGGRDNLARVYNLELRARAAQSGVELFDLARLAVECGLERWHSSSYWFHSKHPFSPGLAGRVAFRGSRVLAALKGMSKKVIVLDLDNTLWGGTIGDDGVEGIRLGDGSEGEAFSAFQEYLKGLAGRGIVLAVASKNEEEKAKQPFLEHPGMRLSLDDISSFKANWSNKADSIRDIADELNLGLDSFVFLDDNPAERALVRSELPMVATPDLPADPADFVPFLERLDYFETAAYSAEDRSRGRMYRENARRNAMRSQVTDMNAYLDDLDMRADSGLADAFHVPRMAQLLNKSNQFHPTSMRCTEAELRVLAERGDHIVRWYSLRDRFGDHGLIAALILRRDADAFVIDAWAMSCRVLERGMEEYILGEIAGLARAAGAARLVGRYIPTAKNKLVEGLYERLGFAKTRDSGDERRWWLGLPVDLTARNLFIRNEYEKE